MANPFAAARGQSDRPLLILIDGSSYVFRAYHAVPPLSNRHGVPTHAVYGFTNMLLKAIREARPTHLGVALDLAGPTFRSEIDPQYKATRKETPADLIPQFDLVRQVVRALNVPLLEVPGFEADDVLGTLAARAHADGFRVVLVTGDKDFMQLVGPEILLFDSMRDRWTGVAEVREKLGVDPDRVVDLMALCGDEVDNVPGVPGVGPKTAAQLVQRFGRVEDLLARISEVERPKLREALLASVDSIRRARRLVEIRLDVPLDVTPADLARRPPLLPELTKLFEELEFTRLARDLPAVLLALGVSAEPVATAVESVITPWTPPEVCLSAEAIQGAVDGLGRGPVAIFPELSRGEASPRLVGIALAGGEGTVRAFYVPLELGAGPPTGEAELFPVLRPPTSPAGALAPLVRLLEDPEISKVGFGLKRAWTALRVVGVELKGLAFDGEIACYLLDPGRRELLLSDISRERLGCAPPVVDAFRARPRLPHAEPSADAVAPGACAAAEVSLRLWPLLERELKEQGFEALFRSLELPLLPVLAAMEWVGIRLDPVVLAGLSRELEVRLGELVLRIHALAGHEFNVASNRQLAQVLFEELHLPILRRTKTGPSTDQEVLERLAADHPLPAAILEQRSLSKLKGTYLDALPQLIDPRDGRIHTTFNQSTAATGRLSSSDPNLQNIPTRSDLGRRIREAFVASPGQRLISADYSQIELRVLAHVSGDAALRESFARGEDVHTRTAAEVFSVPPEAVTAEMRRTAKAINFGIAYGQSAFGLSQRLGLAAAEAQAIIDRYFARYVGVRRWLDQTIERARIEGSVSTLFGRRRLLPDIRSKNAAMRQACERMAVNTPIQGAAADLIKRAMLRADELLRTRGLAARMILQVHDELLFEAPTAETDAVQDLAREAMEGAGTLDVPLVVTIGVGGSWAAIH